MYFVNIPPNRTALHNLCKAFHIIHVNFVTVFNFTDCILAVFDLVSDENPFAVLAPAVAEKEDGLTPHVNACPDLRKELLVS